LLVVDEDIQNGILGCHNNSRVQTPNIDAFAARAVRFDNAYCQMPECGPSRGAIFSGLRPQETGVYDNKASFKKNAPAVPLMPGLFKENGYYTVGSGKLLHPPDNQDPHLWSHLIRNPVEWPEKKEGEWRNFSSGLIKWAWWWSPDCEDNALPDGRRAEDVCTFLESYDRKEPFFLGVGFGKPHDPFVAPKRYFDLYPLDLLELPGDDEPKDASPIHPANYNPNFGKIFSRQDEREYLRSRYACMTYVDSQFGKVMDCVEKEGLFSDTVIVFMGDHGYHHGDHGGHWGKWTLYETSLKAPLIVYDPERAKGKTGVCQGAVEFIDLFPTLCELCGVPKPKQLSGKSLIPLLSDPKREWNHPAFGAWRSQNGRAVRLQRWKYMEWEKGRAGRALFDLETDPNEYYNLADKKEFVDRVQEMAQLIENTYY